MVEIFAIFQGRRNWLSPVYIELVNTPIVDGDSVEVTHIGTTVAEPKRVIPKPPPEVKKEENQDPGYDRAERSSYMYNRKDPPSAVSSPISFIIAYRG